MVRSASEFIIGQYALFPATRKSAWREGRTALLPDIFSLPRHLGTADAIAVELLVVVHGDRHAQ